MPHKIKITGVFFSDNNFKNVPYPNYLQKRSTINETQLNACHFLPFDPGIPLRSFLLQILRFSQNERQKKIPPVNG